MDTVGAVCHLIIAAYIIIKVAKTKVTVNGCSRDDSG